MVATKNKGNTYIVGRNMILAAFATKGFKSWVAREGYGAQTTLLKGGKVIGVCTDEGNGGEVSFDANSAENRELVRKFVGELPDYDYQDYHDFLGIDRTDFPGGRTKWQVYDFANVMLEHAEEDKQLRKVCKTKTVIKVVGEDGYRTFKIAWPKGNKGRQDYLTTQIAEQYGAFEIVNARFDLS